MFLYFHVLTVSAVASELLILSLDLVKNRVGVLSPDMRKGFIGAILVGLIEKTTDPKVMKAITKMVEDWVKTKVSEPFDYFNLSLVALLPDYCHGQQMFWIALGAQF